MVELIKLTFFSLAILIFDMSTFDPDALECLAAIVEEGGFERAAVRLSITQSAVSQRLRSLEVQVGTVLRIWLEISSRNQCRKGERKRAMR